MLNNYTIFPTGSVKRLQITKVTLHKFRSIRIRAFYRSVIHRRKSKSWNSDLTDVSGVSSSRKDPRLDLQLVLVRGPGEGLEPGIVLRNGGHRLVGELLDELDVDIASSLIVKK